MPLKSITVPCLASDKGGFAALLSVWSDPRLFPLREGETCDPIHLCVVLNKSNEAEVQEFQAIFAKFTALHSVFCDCVVLDAELEGERDLYARDTLEAQGAYGNKAGPNFQFFAAMRLVHPYGGFTFLNELDCYPLYAGWLTDLRAMIQERRFAWVIGAHYTGHHPLGQELRYHFNGNAVYQTGCPRFQTFLTEIWEPRLMDMVALDPNVAYDCWWALEAHRASSERRNEAWNIVANHAQFFCNNQFLINTLQEVTVLQDTVQRLHVANVLGQSCIFLHGHATTSLVDAFLKSTDVDFPAHIVDMHQDRMPEEHGAYADGPLDDDDTPLLEVKSLVRTTKDLLPQKPLVIGELPRSRSVLEIARDCFVGNWHKEGPADHIWAGEGLSALHIKFDTPINDVRLLLYGATAPGWQGDLKILAIAGHCVTEHYAPGDIFAIVLHDDKPFQELTLLFEGSGPVFVEGDTRDLVYALFKLDLFSHVSDQT